MPVQKDLETFIQFRYEPTYLEDELHLQSDPNVVLERNGIEAVRSSINLDGGNVIRWSDKVIITKRAFSENPDWDEEPLIAVLERLFEAEILLIPDIKDHELDMTGHADGHVRFIDGKTVLVNQLENEYIYWRDGVLKMIRQSGLDYVEMPWFEHKDRKHPKSAIGCYVNYLEIGDLILFPVFEIPGNQDNAAVDIISKAFPDKKIEAVNINEIAWEGGLLNCVSWGVKKGTLGDSIKRRAGGIARVLY